MQNLSPSQVMEEVQTRQDPLTSLTRGAQLMRGPSVLSTASTILPAYEPPPRPLSPAHSTIREDSETSAVPSRRDVSDHISVAFPPHDLEQQAPAPLLRAPTYRSMASIIPPYSRWRNKYQELTGHNGSIRSQPNRWGCMMDYGWRIWGVVVVVILTTMITIIVAVIVTQKKQ